MQRKFQFMLLALIVVLSGCADGGNSETGKKTSKAAKPKKELTYDLENGKAVYDKICMACHLTGVAGAAKITDAERWAEVAPKGLKELQQSVINGIPDGKYGVMPERGSCTDCSNQDLIDAVAYILDEAGVLNKAK